MKTKMAWALAGAVVLAGAYFSINEIKSVVWVNSPVSTGKAPHDNRPSRNFSQTELEELAKYLTIGDAVPLTPDGAPDVEYMRRAAEAGLVIVQTTLGLWYAKGEHVPKDEVESVKWFRRAALQNDAKAQLYLGGMYANGEGVPKDSVEAVKWYRKAADQGNVDAQGNLGAMYANGEGVPKDAVEGLAWSNVAAASGEELFVKNRDQLERRVGAEATLAAQQRSKQILKEIEIAKRAPSSSAPQNPADEFTKSADRPKGSGSGTVVSTTGHILTAAHVVVGATRLSIVTAQGTMTARVLHVDEANDLAVLKISSGTFVALPVALARNVRLGQTVATIGFPNIQIQGFSPKVTKGEISSVNGFRDDPRSWQISVPVQPGNSGGPLLDENGNLIGVVVSKLGMRAAKLTGDIPQNVNFAIKSSYALALLEPYLDAVAPQPNRTVATPLFEDMVARAQQSVVLILAY